MERLRVLKSSKNMRGTVTCDNTTMHLLQANDFVAEAIRKEMKERNILTSRLPQAVAKRL
jgi:hydrogenase nickel incorporation protein HypB